MLNKFSKTALDLKYSVFSSNLKYSVFSSNWVGFTLYASVHHAFIEMRTMAERTIQGVIFINCQSLKGCCFKLGIAICAWTISTEVEFKEFETRLKHRLAPLEIVFSVSRFEPALNWNQFLAVQRCGLNF